MNTSTPLQLRIALFVSSCVVLPVVQLLMEKKLLVGVVVTPRVDADSVQLREQLAQMQIPVVAYNMQDTDATVQQIQSIGANLGLIATFSMLLPKAVMACFGFGMFNIHASPLPAYRGANPIFWQLKHGEQKSAVVIHQVEASMDSGSIAVSYGFDIHTLDTYGTLVGTAFHLMPVVISEFLALFEKHGANMPLQAQQGEANLAPHPKRDDTVVRWKTMGTQAITNLARACNPNMGGAQMLWKGAWVGLMQATVVENRPSFGVPPGTIIHIGAPDGLLVATIDGVLSIEVVYMMDGAFSGLHFAQRFSLNAGKVFKSGIIQRKE